MSDVSRSSARPRTAAPGFAQAEVPPTPRVLSPGTIAMLWLVVVTLLAMGLLAWRVAVPVPIRGFAVGTADTRVRTLVVLPARAREHIGAGTQVLGEGQWVGTIERIEAPMTDPQSLGAPGTAVDPRTPSCLVWVVPAPPAADHEPLALGQTRAVRAIVERTALSLLWDDATEVMPGRDGVAQ